MTVCIRFDAVLDIDSRPRFQGSTDETVEYLEGLPTVEKLWVSIGETGDLLTASEYLDLAS
jgi:hypothetical protein